MGIRIGRGKVATIATTLAALVAGAAAVTTPAAARGTDRDEILGRNVIVFGSLRAGNDDIYVVNANGSRERRLTTDPAFDSAPAPSPDRRSDCLWLGPVGSDAGLRDGR
jgi:hypothetical protein